MGGLVFRRGFEKNKKKPHVVDTRRESTKPAYSRELLLLLVVETFTRAETLPTASSHWLFRWRFYLSLLAVTPPLSLPLSLPPPLSLSLSLS